MRHPADTQATQQHKLRLSKVTLDAYGYDEQIMNTSLYVYIPTPQEAPS